MKYYDIVLSVVEDSKEEVKQIADDIKEILDDANIKSHYYIEEQSYAEE